jgi:hypothetical protein
VIPEPARNFHAVFLWRDGDLLDRWKGRVVAFRDDGNVKVRDRLKGGDSVVLLDQDSARVERRSDTDDRAADPLLVPSPRGS